MKTKLAITLAVACALAVGFFAGLFYQFTEVTIYDAKARSDIADAAKQEVVAGASAESSRYRQQIFDLEGEVAVLDWKLRQATERAEAAEEMPDVEVIAVRLNRR